MTLRSALEHVETYVERWMMEGKIPGLALAITDRERLLGLSTFGVADLSTGKSVEADTLFEIGSLGKPFTSIALLQLRDAGQLDLHAPVSRYLPWFQVESDFPPTTVHHLMNHTAGIVRGTDLAPHGLFESWALRQTRTVAAPGEYFSYSNIGYKTLGFLLEKLTGKPLHDVVQTRILTPLGMNRSFPAVTVATRRQAAIGYCGIFDDRPEHHGHELVPATWAEYATGDGCEASTAPDMAKYLRLLLNRGKAPQRRLLSEESFNMMALQGVWTGGDFYGYGLATYPDGGRTYLGHGGGNAGFRSALVVDLESGLGVVFLVNRMGETDPVVAAAQHVLTVVRAAHAGEDLPAMPAPVVPGSVPDAADYAGTYRDEETALTLRAANGGLLLELGRESIALERREADTFYVPHPDYELFLLEFKRHDGKVAEAFHGSRWYRNEAYAGPRHFEVPPEWYAYPGHYRGRSPELSNFRIVLRKGRLTLIIPWGNSEPLVALDDSRFRISDDPLAPERLHFDAVVDGRALRVDYSGCPYYRAFTP